MYSERLAAKKRVQLIKNLPAMPGVIDQINRAVDSKHFSMEDIGKRISRDQVLTAKILKLANSAFFGFSRKVGSLTQALVLLGLDVVKGLIITSSVFDLTEHRADDLWAHSMGVAATAGLLAKHMGIDDVEEVGVAGLLHDLGKVVLRARMPEDMAEINRLVEERKKTVREAEWEVLGFDHSHVGQWLSEAWKLPVNLTEPIRWHHQPEDARREPLFTAVVHFSDILVRGYGYGDADAPWVPPLEREALKRLNLTLENLKMNDVQDTPAPAQDATQADGAVFKIEGRAVIQESINLLRRLEGKSMLMEGDRFASEEERQAFVQAQEQALDERFSRVQDDKVLVAMREMFRQRLRQDICAQAPEGKS